MRESNARRSLTSSPFCSQFLWWIWVTFELFLLSRKKSTWFKHFIPIRIQKSLIKKEYLPRKNDEEECFLKTNFIQQWRSFDFFQMEGACGSCHGTRLRHSLTGANRRDGVPACCIPTCLVVLNFQFLFVDFPCILYHSLHVIYFVLAYFYFTWYLEINMIIRLAKRNKA